MTDLQQLLDREAERIDEAPGALESVVRASRRRTVTRRVGAAALALTVAAIAVAVLLQVVPRPGSTPATPGPSGPSVGKVLPENGTIAVRAGSLIEVDPTTGDHVTPVLGSNVGPTTAYLDWSRDGRWLAYLEDGRVWVLDVTTGTSRSVAPSCAGCAVALSPDGSTVAFSGPDGIVLVAADGGRRTLISTPAGEASWSPDGNLIAFVISGAPEGNPALFVVDINSSRVQRLVTAATDAPLGDPSWSPNGESIAYVTSTPTGKQSEQRLEVDLVARNGGTPARVAQLGTCFCVGFQPGMTWSPDGRQFALVVPGPDHQPYGLYVMNADGSGLRFLARASGHPVWRPLPRDR